MNKNNNFHVLRLWSPIARWYGKRYNEAVDRCLYAYAHKRSDLLGNPSSEIFEAFCEMFQRHKTLKKVASWGFAHDMSEVSHAHLLMCGHMKDKMPLLSDEYEKSYEFAIGNLRTFFAFLDEKIRILQIERPFIFGEPTI